MYQTLVFHRGRRPKRQTIVMHNTQGAACASHNVNILVVDDEEALCNLMQISLQRQGYKVTVARNGREALDVLDKKTADLVILDVMMPEMDGFTTCTEIRKRSDVPIVMLTALNRPDDIVHGFNLGADDYITKPFTFREVEVRLQAILRRMNWVHEDLPGSEVEAKDILINEELHEVKVRGDVVRLTPIEYQLLRCLIGSPDRPISKEDLFQNVWGYTMAGGTNLVEVAMRRLREKVELDPSDPAHLVTVRGAGYMFNTQAAPNNIKVT